MLCPRVWALFPNSVSSGCLARSQGGLFCRLILRVNMQSVLVGGVLRPSNKVGFVRCPVRSLTFLFVQGYEYSHAYSELNLKLSSGIYGSTFFMLTGFHGFHVFVGMLMLLFITLRLMKGHFTPQRHFGFEGAAWYWHFVDVVWLGLYILVYWM